MDYAIKIDSRRAHGLTVLEISDTLKIFTDAVTMLIESLHDLLRLHYKRDKNPVHNTVLYTIKGELSEEELTTTVSQIRQLAAFPIDAMSEMYKLIKNNRHGEQHA